MDHNFNVREYLLSVQLAKFRFKRCEAQLAELRDRCESITASWSGMPGGSGDVHKDAPLIALADKRTQLKQFYAEWEAAEEDVDRFLSLIPDHRLRAILQLRYVGLLPWPKVQTRLREAGIYYEERQVFNLHGKALNAARDLWSRREKEGTAREDSNSENKDQ